MAVTLGVPSTIIARFTPQRTDDIGPDGLEAIGEVMTWGYLEPANEGDYAGETRWWCFTKKIGWVPERDLTILSAGPGETWPITRSSSGGTSPED